MKKIKSLQMESIIKNVQLKQIKTCSVKKLFVTMILALLCNVSLSQNLSHFEKRISKFYEESNFYKAYNLGDHFIKKGKRSSVIYYITAMSNYQLNKFNFKSYQLDRTLQYLELSDVANNDQIRLLSVSDSLNLGAIKYRAESFSQKQLVSSNRKAVKRLNRLIVIFEDSSDVLITYLDNLEYKRLYSKARADKTIYVDSEAVSVQSYSEFKSQKANEVLVYMLEQNNFTDLTKELEDIYNISIAEQQKEVLNTASKEYGTENFKKSKSNPEILKYFKETGFGNIKSDETNWCAAFVNYCVKQNGYDYPRSLVAKSWLNQGQKVIEPKTGDIIVFWREKKNSWKGHVAFFIEADEENGLIYCYGGNQDGKVCVKAYPEERVLAYRRLIN